LEIASKQQRNAASSRSIFSSTATIFADSNRTRTQNHDGRRWHAKGRKVMQFIDAGKYVAVMGDGKIKTYG
jgi:hypothetical protein